MTIAIHYSSTRLPNEVREVFGLQVAVSNWIKAYFKFSGEEKFYFLVGNENDWHDIENLAVEVGIDSSRLHGLDRRYPEENFSQFSTIFRTDPVVGEVLWQRQLTPGAGYTFCGLSHTIGGIEAGDALEKYCLGPSEPTDAIVCPSRAVRAAIRAFWDNYGDFIQQKFGAAYRCPVELPIIPLGIDIEKFERATTADKRAAQRTSLGLGDKDIVVLWVGRLSHAIKAHPIAMFQAVERAAKLTGASVHFVMFGYFFPEEAGQNFRDLAADICRTARVTFVANDDPRFPDGVWAAGDIFLSLVDNMQESFGLTPIEAMAAGLPRVLTDWDGYRDSVIEGEDGFLIPTTQPPPGMGFDLSALLAKGREVYGGFMAKSAHCVAVDQDVAAEKLALLIRNPDLRRAMGSRAHNRVRPTYDWRTVIADYQSLWHEMSERRLREQAGKPRQSWPYAMPQVPDPFTMYAGFPTSALQKTDRLSVVATMAEIKGLWSHGMNVLAMDIMLPPDKTTELINAIAAAKQPTIGDILTVFPHDNEPRLWRTIAWLLKLGVLRRTS